LDAVRSAAVIAQISILPRAASTTAAQVDVLSIALFIVCFSVGLLVAILLFGFSIRYRRRSTDTDNPPATHPSHALEWFWTLTPMIIFIGFFAWGGAVYYSAFTPPPDAMSLYVVGKQWMWKFQHPEGQREIATLHVPAGRPIRLIMISEDVIHSFFVPAFRLHMDVLPQRYTSAWFEATRPGTYHLFCSQYCGTNHSGMVGRVIVMEPAEYQAWLTYSAEGSLALQGRQVVLKYRCLSCHSATATARAPVLEDIMGSPVPLKDGRFVIADDNYIRESILQPSAKLVAGHADIMPSFAGQVSEEEIIAVIAYLRSLKVGQTPDRVEDFPPPSATPPINSTDEAP
jgi:cytochrome c oxidase subunit 2